ncbi:MAG: hypothetical protein JXR76_31125 [Deltaproteobacteria bacterium]|nr:hypothetical protein [Deltaproteobacteria bacterium]
MAEDLNWQKWLKQGDQYLGSATPKEGKKSKFGAGIRYNLLSMSLEAYIMAILDYHHTMPVSHTVTDLVEGLEAVMPLDKELKAQLLKYENIQSICSVKSFHLFEPTEEDLAQLRDAINRISAIAHESCATAKETPSNGHHPPTVL